ncbi:MAG TPA: hypothetical protein VE688_07520 [Gaiellaceae bacterium]|nr:hypothetical protein [Gaiellaceae bacterium]
MARRLLLVLTILSFGLLGTTAAAGRSSRSNVCGASPYSYAGVQGVAKAHGVGATLVALAPPEVSAGHVGAWIGVGGVDAGPHGAAEWLQVGYSAFPSDRTSRIYYEVTVAGSAPKYVELDSAVKPGQRHTFKVLETAGRNGWWRVWLDGKAVTAPIHLPGSHERWYPEAEAESWNGGVRACNTLRYRFSNVKLAHANGGDWRPLRHSITFHDAGYRLVQLSRVPRSFLATSLGGRQRIETGVPTGMRRASARMAALRMRTQP